MVSIISEIWSFPESCGVDITALGWPDEKTEETQGPTESKAVTQTVLFKSLLG